MLETDLCYSGAGACAARRPSPLRIGVSAPGPLFRHSRTRYSRLAFVLPSPTVVAAMDLNDETARSQTGKHVSDDDDISSIGTMGSDHMHIYIYIYIYAHIYIYVFVYVYVCGCVYVCVHVYVSASPEPRSGDCLTVPVTLSSFTPSKDHPCWDPKLQQRDHPCWDLRKTFAIFLWWMT